jgi:hypothetical protein
MLEHRAKKWAPVFRKSDATTNNESIARKSGNRFFAKAMRQQTTRASREKVGTGFSQKLCDNK